VALDVKVKKISPSSSITHEAAEVQVAYTMESSDTTTTLKVAVKVESKIILY